MPTRQEKRWPREGRVDGDGGNRAYGGTRSGPLTGGTEQETHLPLPGTVGKSWRRPLTVVDEIIGFTALVCMVIALIWPEKWGLVVVAVLGALHCLIAKAPRR